jgi:hypothetical protein
MIQKGMLIPDQGRLIDAHPAAPAPGKDESGYYGRDVGG